MTIKIESVTSKYYSLFIKLAIAIAVAIAILQFFAIKSIRSNKIELSNKEIRATINFLQRDITEKIAIVASSSIFIDFLRSGEITRSKLNLEMQYLLSSIKEESLIGIELLDNEFNNIFSYGKTTNHKVMLTLCYVDYFLNETYGKCTANIILYLSKQNIISRLKEMNPLIETCKSCNVSFFENSKKIGSFNVTSISDFSMNIQLRGAQDFSDLFIGEIIFFATLLLVSLLLHQTFKSVSHEYIYEPVKELASALNQGVAVNLNKIRVAEIHSLGESFNKFILNSKEQELLRKRMEMVDMANQVAHDIRSPLSALDMVISGTENIPEIEKSIINHAIRRINDIANSLLNYRQNTNNTKIQSVSPLLQSIVSEKRILIKNLDGVKIYLTESNESQKTFINIDDVDLKRVISNLINNAIEALPNSMGFVKITSRVISNNLSITIEDNGKGIPPDILSKLFKNGATFGKDTGNGLGLFNAKEVVEKFYGKIYIESYVGRGTKITITFPLTESPK